MVLRILAMLGSVGILLGPSGVFADEASKSAATFYKDILPIFQNQCQECHRPAGSNFGGMVAPMSLMSYEESRPWAKSIAQKVKSREMPPWHAAPEHHGVFSNERSLSELEIEAVVKWAATGAPAGNPADAPSPRVFENKEGWLIGEPDLIVAMPKPYFVSDETEDQYTAFSVDLTEEQLPADKWITAFQCKPGSKFIHHFNCHLLVPVDGKLPPPRSSPESDTIAPVGAGIYIGGTSSGTDANRYPEGFGLPLKKGTRVTFDIHYHKEAGPGTGAFDLSHIGFKLTDKPPKRQVGVGGGPISTFAIEIPPGAKRYQLGPLSRAFNKEMDIVSLMPHMHMRGTAATFEAIYPDGRREMLLHVPKYDFSWQTVYYYKDLKRIPAGTKIEYTAWYDNSEEMAAIRKFDPKQTVKFGQASTDEMMMGFVMAAPVEKLEGAKD